MVRDRRSDPNENDLPRWRRGWVSQVFLRPCGVLYLVLCQAVDFPPACPARMLVPNDLRAVQRFRIQGQ